MIQPSNKYFIGTIGFTTKKSCANYTRMIVNALDTRIIVNESHIHFTFLCDLIQNHPDSGDKIGAGIKHFIVTQNYINKSNTLAVMRCDDSKENFSWTWGSNCRDYLKEAYRILESGGVLHIVEPTKRWSETEGGQYGRVKEGTEAVKLIELLKNTGFRVETIQIEKFCYFRCVK